MIISGGKIVKWLNFITALCILIRKFADIYVQNCKINTLQDFFDPVWHQNMYAYNENNIFLIKSCHCQTYKNYEQPPQSLYILAKSLFGIKNQQTNGICLIFFCKEYFTSRSTFMSELFWKLWFLEYFIY